MSSKLRRLRVEARTRMHEPVREQHRWLCSVLRGHDAYYGLPSNHHALGSFHHEVQRLWFRALYRQSQRSMTWADFNALSVRFPLPEPRITHDRDARP